MRTSFVIRDVVPRLYASATQRRPDTSVLDDFRDWIGAEHVVVADLKDKSAWRTCQNLIGVPTRAFAEFMQADDYRTTISRFSQTRPVFRITDVVDREALRTSESYRTVLRHLNGGLAGLALWQHNQQSHAILFCRSLSRDRDFSDRDLTRIRILLPHLAAAHSIRHSLDQANLLTTITAASLDSLSQGLIVLGASDDILYQNLCATRILERRDGLVRLRHGLCGEAPSATHRLRHAIQAARALGRTSMTGRLDERHHGETSTIPMPRGSGKQPLILNVLPVFADGLARGSTDAALISILILDPESAGAGPSARDIQASYDLTRRESELVARLVAGEPLTVAADRLGITRETARQYLKRIFGKLGVHRQGELVHHIRRGSG